MLQILLDMPGRDLDSDRAALRALPQHRNHGLQVLFGADLREAAGALDILSRLFPPQCSNLRRDLFSGQMPAHTRLCALSDLDLNGVRAAQIVVRDAVLVRDIFKDVFISGSLLLGQNAALAAAHGCFRHGAAF